MLSYNKLYCVTDNIIYILYTYHNTSTYIIISYACTVVK